MAFGAADAIDSTEDLMEGNSGHSHIIQTPESSVVVSTVSTHVESNTADGEEDLRIQPRGFFADQFEVRFSTLFSSRI